MGSETSVAGFEQELERFSPGDLEWTWAEADQEAQPTSGKVRPEIDAPMLEAAQDKLERCANSRVRLLARAYVRGATAESEARLAILTERLGELLPPVSHSQWETLTEIGERLQGREDRHRETMERLGLK